MKPINILVLSFGMFASAAAMATPSPTQFTLKDPSGKSVGNVTMTQLEKGVKVVLDVQGLPAGEHAIHFHEKGMCQGPGFDSAGEHFAPRKSKHGFDVAGGPHAGDMPNLWVSSDGTAHFETINTQVSLGKGSNSLLKEKGTTIIVHSQADDHRSQPSGEAGGRIACAEIKR